MKQIATLLVLLVFVASCSREKTEKEKYESATSGTKYKLYKTLSKNTVGPAFLVYDLARPKDSARTSEPVLRLLLGYSWAVSQKTTFAFAECDIIQNSDADAETKFLANVLTAVAMYEEGWKNLAAAEANKGMKLLNKNPDMKYSKEHIMIFHLLMGTVCIYEKELRTAKFHFQGFGEATGIKWPALLVDAMADLNDGKIQQGLKKVKALSKDPSIPRELRDHLATTIAEIEKKTGSVDAFLFWPRMVSWILFDDIKKAGWKGFGKVADFVNDMREKLGAAL
jgi:hypothetical protein